MVGTITARRARIRNIFAVAAALAITVAVACGSEDPAPAAAPTATPPIQATAAPEPTSASVPSPVTLADGVTVEPGSKEAEIFAMWERAIGNVRVRDIEAFQADCLPDLQARVSFDVLADLLEKDSNNPAYGQPVYTGGINVVLHDFRGYRDTLSVTYEWREGEDVIGTDLADNFEKVDGRWYMASGLCLGG